MRKATRTLVNGHEREKGYPRSWTLVSSAILYILSTSSTPTSSQPVHSDDTLPENKAISNTKAQPCSTRFTATIIPSPCATTSSQALIVYRPPSTGTIAQHTQHAQHTTALAHAALPSPGCTTPSASSHHTTHHSISHHLASCSSAT